MVVGVVVVVAAAVVFGAAVVVGVVGAAVVNFPPLLLQVAQQISFSRKFRPGVNRLRLVLHLAPECFFRYL